MRKSQAGFTLLEVLIVVAIIIVISGIAAPKVSGMVDNARESRVLGDLRVLQNGVSSILLYGNITALPNSQTDLQTALEGNSVSGVSDYAGFRDPFGSGSYQYASNGKYFVVWSLGKNGTAGITGIDPNGEVQGNLSDDLFVTNGRARISQGNPGQIALPSTLTNFLAGQIVLRSFDYAALGLADGAPVQYDFDSQGRLTRLRDQNGRVLIEIEYAANGQISMIKDRVNRLAVEYATANTYTYKKSSIVEVNDYRKFIYSETTHTVSGVLGKVLNVYMTNEAGAIMTGNDIVNNSWFRGFLYMADRAPLVPYYSGPMPYTSDYYSQYGYRGFHTSDRVNVLEVRHENDGSAEIRRNAFTAGVRLGVAEVGMYAYSIERYNPPVGGNPPTVAQREWFNDPIPTRYEPTFTGTVERDSMGRFFMRVQSALGDQGQNQTATYQGKSFLLTTRLTDTTATNNGGQPGPYRFDLQERSSATNGGAAQFTARNWDSLVGQQVSLQGHLMTSAVSETGITYQGQKSGVFSAFRIL